MTVPLQTESLLIEYGSSCGVRSIESSTVVAFGGGRPNTSGSSDIENGPARVPPTMLSTISSPIFIVIVLSIDWRL